MTTHPNTGCITGGGTPGSRWGQVSVALCVDTDVSRVPNMSQCFPEHDGDINTDCTSPARLLHVCDDEHIQ